MKRKRIGSMLIIMETIWCVCCIGGPGFASSGYQLTVAPFVEYDYLNDLGAGQDLLDRINEQVGGWLSGYDNIELFQHMFIFGVEIRIAYPDRWRGWELVASVATNSGSLSMLGKDYDEWNDLDTIPIIPGVMNTSTIPFTNVDGQVHIQVDQYMDYCFPLQVGVRYEVAPTGGPVNFFGLISGGLLVMKGGLDIDIYMNGSVNSPVQSMSTHARYRGNAEFQDTGWLMNFLVGIRYTWRKDLSSSVTLGYGIGELDDDVDVDGTLIGSADTTILGISGSIPFNLPTNFKEDTKLEIDGWRFRLIVIEWTWQ
ncbi:MAG: hypothetical protein KJ737_05045 [Proteobacteria bacterium]|nr:hypothetical protein [Pseudomonadota bacterium]